MNYKTYIHTVFTFALGFLKRHIPKIKSRKGKYECNLCGNRTDHFLDDGWHENIICPYCHSDVRHRLEYAIFQFIGIYKKEKLFDRKCVLHFAAEKQLVNQLAKGTRRYICADIKTGTDITNMTKFTDETFDIVIANDVLEHIVNLTKGISEVYRVLINGGYFICTVPQRDHLEQTEEDPNINTPELREKHYGQNDHLRIFGNDFKEILEKLKFKVTVIDKSCFSEEVVERYILFPKKLSSKNNVTNYRKIYIGRK